MYTKSHQKAKKLLFTTFPSQLSSTYTCTHLCFQFWEFFVESSCSCGGVCEARRGSHYQPELLWLPLRLGRRHLLLLLHQSCTSSCLLLHAWRAAVADMWTIENVTDRKMVKMSLVNTRIHYILEGTILFVFNLAFFVVLGLFDYVLQSWWKNILNYNATYNFMTLHHIVKFFINLLVFLLSTGGEDVGGIRIWAVTASVLLLVQGLGDEINTEGRQWV